MAIELHHLHPSHDAELTRLKARIAELERMDTEHTLQIEKMNGYIHHLEEELETYKRKEKESRELADTYTLDVLCSPMDYARSLNHTKQQRIKRNGRKGK